ncbi:hypothetical protein HKX48_004709 [Thoreauomyces humboldtii]|nr:hypothetical protein HKX48_004709 [Thoreauomyces humboldtii]
MNIYYSLQMVTSGPQDIVPPPSEFTFISTANERRHCQLSLVDKIPALTESQRAQARRSDYILICGAQTVSQGHNDFASFEGSGKSERRPFPTGYNRNIEIVQSDKGHPDADSPGATTAASASLQSCEGCIGAGSNYNGRIRDRERVMTWGFEEPGKGARSSIDLEIWDYPGNVDLFDPSFDAQEAFEGSTALVFVIDAQDEYLEALQRLYMTVTRAHKVNPDISFEVFIHKVDGLSDDHKIETQRDIHQRISDELSDAQLDNIHLSFHLTSIYDHSIYEAISKVIQKLIPQLATFENLLNILCSNSGIEKAFLFDIMSKVYIATDSSPVDMQSYELCSDMIDVIFDVSCIYNPPSDAISPVSPSHHPPTESHATIRLNNGMVLYLREVNKYLSLVTLLREDNFEKQGLIDYNFRCFQEAILEVFVVRKRAAGSRRARREEREDAQRKNKSIGSATELQ